MDLSTLEVLFISPYSSLFALGEHIIHTLYTIFTGLFPQFQAAVDAHVEARSEKKDYTCGSLFM